jgi:chemotaxis response regulator CheB
MVLASKSRFLVEGIQRSLLDRCGLRIVGEAFTRQELKRYITQLKPDFLFLDNRAFGLNLHSLLGLITGKSPSTKVILLNGQNRESPDYSNLICIGKEAGTSELIRIIKGKSLSTGKHTVKGRKKKSKRSVYSM